MAIHVLKNWAWKTPEGIKPGDTFIKCNFTQFEPDTEIFQLGIPYTFINCTMTNVKLNVNMALFQCGTARVIYEDQEEWDGDVLILKRKVIEQLEKSEPLKVLLVEDFVQTVLSPEIKHKKIRNHYMRYLSNWANPAEENARVHVAGKKHAERELMLGVRPLPAVREI